MDMMKPYYCCIETITNQIDPYYFDTIGELFDLVILKKHYKVIKRIRVRYKGNGIDESQIYNLGKSCHLFHSSEGANPTLLAIIRFINNKEKRVAKKNYFDLRKQMVIIRDKKKVESIKIFIGETEYTEEKFIEIGNRAEVDFSGKFVLEKNNIRSFEEDTWHFTHLDRLETLEKLRKERNKKSLFDIIAAILWR